MVQTLLQQYRDIPDGTECHRKTYASTTLSGAAGLIFSAYSVTLQPPDSFLEGVARTGRYTFTAAHSYGIGAAACAYMGTIAALVKMGQLEGWKVFAAPKV
uniref:NADH dehydrogenase [ubiquinone] 1 alpha subcomplex subunit 11 n=1 Tax=Panthera tigris altaica TaxID=74533 RepID=A0A8C9KRM2_PANTA